MNDYKFIEKPVDFSRLKSHENIQEFVKYNDKNFISQVDSAEKMVGWTILDNLEEIKSKMKDGDELVYLISPEWTWDCLAGRAGYAIKRGDEIVEENLVWMS